MNSEILGIQIEKFSKKDILEKILKNTRKRSKFLHIVSLNPENFVESAANPEFKKAIESAQIKIIDGVGVEVAGRLLGVDLPNRLTGVDLMIDLLKSANEYSLTVGLIGAGPKIAEQVVECQKTVYPRLKIIGLEGIKNINSPEKLEESRIFSIVSDFKPHLVFVSFGSPAQEIWIDRHKDKFKGSVCMGVGGAFDYLSGRIPRAPKIVRKIGLEWLFRLIRQPWRIKRQIHLLKFIYLVFLQKAGLKKF